MQLIGYEIADMYYCGETSCCHENIFRRKMRVHLRWINLDAISIYPRVRGINLVYIRRVSPAAVNSHAIQIYVMDPAILSYCAILLFIEIPCSIYIGNGILGPIIFKPW